MTSNGHSTHLLEKMSSKFFCFQLYTETFHNFQFSLIAEMNFEGAKENIQPLAAGRNVEQLEVALNAESHHECQEELLEQRRQFEMAITNYAGDDPLELWYEYIGWVEQSYPKSGKASALDDLLKKTLSKFEKDSRYTQDPRLIRLFIKYVSLKHLCVNLIIITKRCCFIDRHQTESGSLLHQVIQRRRWHHGGGFIHRLGALFRCSR